MIFNIVAGKHVTIIINLLQQTSKIGCNQCYCDFHLAFQYKYTFVRLSEPAESIYHI